MVVNPYFTLSKADSVISGQVLRALFGGVSVALRGIALGSAAAAARRSSTAKKYRLALAISGICIVSVGSVNLPWALHISGRHRGPAGRDLVRLACRAADAGKRHR